MSIACEIFLQSIDQIQTGLRYGINAYKGVWEAWQASERKGCYPLEKPEDPEVMLVAIDAGTIQNERITIVTKRQESINVKFSCRENLSQTVEPTHLFLHKPLKVDEVGDLAVITFRPSARSPELVCEGLILSKFQMSR